MWDEEEAYFLPLNDFVQGILLMGLPRKADGQRCPTSLEILLDVTLSILVP